MARAAHFFLFQNKFLNLCACLYSILWQSPRRATSGLDWLDLLKKLGEMKVWPH